MQILYRETEYRLSANHLHELSLTTLEGRHLSEQAS